METKESMNELKKELEKERFYSTSSVILSGTSIGMSILNIIGNFSPLAVGLVMIFVAVLEIAFLVWTRCIFTE